MNGQWLCAVILSFFAASHATAGIELISFKQDENPRRARVILGINAKNSNFQSSINIDYPGDCGTMLENGEEKVMLSNADSSIVAFNFQPGTKVNDCIAIVLLPNGQLIYFLNLNQKVAEILSSSKNALNAASFRVVSVLSDGIILEYYEHVSASHSVNFRVRTHISAEGTLHAGAGDVQELNRNK